jgi:hypothetical protein
MKFHIAIAAAILAASPTAVLSQEARALSVLPADHGDKVLVSKDAFPSIEACNDAVATTVKENAQASGQEKGVLYICVPADLTTAERSYPVIHAE